MAYEEDNIKILKNELEKLIVCLDNIAENETVQNIETRIKQLENENTNFKAEISRLSGEVLETGFKLKLAVAQTENVLQENENLQASNKDLESRVFELGELNSYQTDKIKALRSVALALESENELISKEKGRPMKTQEDHCQITKNSQLKVTELEAELLAKEEERKGFLECFELLETDRKELIDKCAHLQCDFTTKCQEYDLLKTNYQLSTDTLDALRQSKRLIETKFQKCVEENEKLISKVEMLTEINKALEVKLENKSSSFVSLQHELEVRTTVYETTIGEIQSELDKLLDQMSVSKDEDAEFVRKTYVKLFDEKAQELNKLEKDFDECKKKLEIADRKIMDSEYREHELEVLLRKKESLLLSSNHYKSEVEEITAYTFQLETQLNYLRDQYGQLCLKFKAFMECFKEDRENQTKITLQDSNPGPIKNIDLNQSFAQSKSKKKRKRKKK